jgi:cysteinyl-tRNA synthetase
MFGLFKKPTPPQSPVSEKLPLFLHNTLSGTKEKFEPRGNTVRMYNCGPTVYGVQHIGNLSMFVFTDTLRKVLEWNGWPVQQVINITDVGHLTSDADSGEDKMTVGLQREGLALTLDNMKMMAEKYTAEFFENLTKLGIDVSTISFPRASEHIHGQIALIQTLEEKGYAYRTKDGMYFDTALFPSYGTLGNIDIAALKEGARVEANPEKHNPADFNLWKFNPNLGWETPWGKGFPGWHIECSAMCRRELGEQIDIHTGGIEHIPVHHNNEIAQSEAATGKHPFSRFWLHRAHLQLNGRKIAKSEGNVVYLENIIAEGIDPLALRYLLLTSHYRTPSNFTWEALRGAERALQKLRTMYQSLTEGATPSTLWLRRFHERINDDLDTPGAIAALWDMLKDEKTPDGEKRVTLLLAERVLGVGITKATAPIEVPKDVAALLAERETSRAEKNWTRADELRAQINALGYEIKDMENGTPVVLKLK